MNAAIRDPDLGLDEEAAQVQASMALEWLKAPDAPSVLRGLAKRIYSLAGGAMVVVTEFDAKNTQTIVRDIEWTEEERKRAVEILGREPLGLKLVLTDEIRRRWVAGALTPVPSVYDLFFRQVPPEVCDRLAEKLEVTQMFGMACAHDTDILGSVAVVTRGDSVLRNKRLIELLVLGAALSLKRIRADLVREEVKTRFGLLFESTSDGVLLHGLDGIVSEVNDAYCRMSGYGRDEIVGTSVFQLQANSAEGEAGPNIRSMLETGGHGRFESKFRRKDGTVFDADVTALYLKKRDGNDMALFVRDVTERRRAERALMEGERRFRSVLENSVDCVYRINCNTGRYEYVSPAVHKILGYSPEEWMEGRAKAALDLVHPADLPKLEGALCRAEEAGDGTVEYRQRTKEGNYRWVSNHISFTQRDGGVRYCEGSLRDITENKRAEEALREANERFTAAVESSQVVVFTQDLELRYTWIANPPLGYRSEDVVGRKDEDLVERPGDARGLGALKRRVLETGTPLREVVPIYDSGVTRWFDVNVQPQVDRGELVGILGAAVDITERRQAEVALREADRQKTDFLALLSHEMRNPLAPIMNGLYMLDRAGLGSETAQRTLEVVRRQTRHLCGLVDDLLDVSRITYGKIVLRLTDFDVREVTRRSTEDVRPDFVDRSIRLDYADTGEHLWVHADAIRIAQIVGNLLSNSLKYTPPGGGVSVNVRGQKENCLIEVKDTGVGIPEEDLDRIFDRFAQVASPSEKPRCGLGLGLALVRELTALHGGTVRAHSDGVGCGAEFVVSIPLTVPSRAPEPMTSTVETPRLKVLIIEDNVDAGTTLADVLELDGHTVRHAASGATGLAEMRRILPDVLLCDIGLPDMSGHEVIAAARGIPGALRMFAVALTGFAQPEDREAALGAGFDAHLPKPPPLEKLQELLACAARRMTDA